MLIAPPNFCCRNLNFTVRLLRVGTSSVYALADGRREHPTTLLAGVTTWRGTILQGSLGMGILVRGWVCFSRTGRQWHRTAITLVSRLLGLLKQKKGHMWRWDGNPRPRFKPLPIISPPWGRSSVRGTCAFNPLEVDLHRCSRDPPDLSGLGTGFSKSWIAPQVALDRICHFD